MRADDIRHVCAFFSIGVTFLMPFTLSTATFDDGICSLWLQTNFYVLYFLFVAGIFTYNFFEYRSLDVKSYRFRNFALWAPAFINSPAVFAFKPTILRPVTLVSPLVVLMLILFSFLGKQPKIKDGRFYPAIFGFLSFIWIFILFKFYCEALK